MSREKEGYRLNLERIDKAFPDRELLSPSDIGRFEGTSRHTARRRYAFNKWGKITKADWARQVSV